MSTAGSGFYFHIYRHVFSVDILEWMKTMELNRVLSLIWVGFAFVLGQCIEIYSSEHWRVTPHFIQSSRLRFGPMSGYFDELYTDVFLQISASTMSLQCQLFAPS